MNKYIYILLIGFLGIMTASCSDWLDKPASEDITEQDAYKDLVNARKVLNNIYLEATTALYNPVSRRFPYEIATTDAVQGYAPLWGNVYKQGSITADTNKDGGDGNESTPPSTAMWKQSYMKIRKANIFISKIMDVPGDEDLKKRFLAEARFLRAFFYATLIRDYGGIIILDKPMDSYIEATTLGRATFQQSVDWVVGELDAIKNDLPTGDELLLATEFGRATKGAAIACKARLLLYAARPLFNTDNPVLPEYTETHYYGNYDKERWKRAADAAQELINENCYELWKGEYNASTGTYPEDKTQVFMDMFHNYSKEYVWGYYPGNWNQSFCEAFNNRSCGGWHWINPTLELAEEFEMTNGMLPNEPGSGYDFENPGKDRDPRFKATIQYPGAVYETYKFEPWIGGSASELNSCLTGMCSQKWLDGKSHPNLPDHPQNGFVAPLVPYYRYTEFLLIQAEALNEYYDSPSAVPGDLVYKNINDIRDRVNMPPLPENLTKEEMRERIKHERHVELTFEDHRLFDLLTWRDAEEELNKDVHGYNVAKGQNDGFFTRTVVGARQVFTKKMYLSPIATFDILLNENLEQNPGY